MATQTTQRIVPRDLTDEEVRFYQENNWVKVDQLLTREQADILLDRLKEKMGENAERGFEPPTGQSQELFRRGGPLAVDVSTGEPADDLFYELSHSPEMGRLGEKIFGKPVRYWVDQALVKLKGDQIATKWHQDSGALDTGVFAPAGTQFMVWVALDHIPPDRGSMRFVPPANQTDEAKKIMAEMDTVESYPDLEKLGVISPPFDLQPGDATIHGSKVFHSAPPNSTDHPRWAYVLSLFGHDATWTGNTHWPLYGVEGMTKGEIFDHPRFRKLS